MSINKTIIKLFIALSLSLFGSALCAEESAQQPAKESQLEVIRGLIKPVTSAVISSEISGQIIKLPFQSGDAFSKGDVLIRVNCALFSAQQASARAVLDSKKKTLENLKRLLALNASSDIDVELAQIEVKKAHAEHKAAAVMVSRCTIKAPYNGRVVDKLVNRYESVAPGEELIAILNDKQLEIEVIVPSRWLVWLKKGLEFEFHIDEIQTSQKAKIIQIGATVDPVSQTVSIKGAFSEQANILAGMSGSAYFSQPE